MPTTQTDVRARLPDDLLTQLNRYRRNVWLTKVAEVIAYAIGALLLAWLSVFITDRVIDTPVWLRAAAMAGAVLGGISIPLGLFRWVWQRRTCQQVARLICRKLPSHGDRLLGILDLAEDEQEQRRSPVLCKAAIDQVAEEAKRWDLSRALPRSHHRAAWWSVGGLSAAVLLLFVVAPQALKSAWLRITPWSDAPRYTFAALDDVPDQLVIPHGESCEFILKLCPSSRWKPTQAKVTVAGQEPILAIRQNSEYAFSIPAQIEDSTLNVRVGDAAHQIRLIPTMRPELESVVTEVTLPSYLQREAIQPYDARAGTVAVVSGSRARVIARANRDLQSASIDGAQRDVQGAQFDSDEGAADVSRDHELRWQDRFGLHGKEPFTLSINVNEDEAPTVSCSGMPRQQVVLVSEQLTFQIQAKDDFGIQEVGIEWHGWDANGKPSSQVGSRLLAAGNPHRSALNATGTFNAESLGIEPQPIALRACAKDYFPGREPVRSAPYFLYVLSADEHMIWLTEQLSKWHRRALEVRDRELKLYAENRRLRALPAEQLDDPATRRQIQRQAAAEKSNGRRLANLTQAGEALLQRAMRNDEFGVGHLEKWAEMMQVLKDISANRMPSVASRLKDAAVAPQVASANLPSSPTAGVDRSESGAQPADPDAGSRPGGSVPQIVDRESSHQKDDTEVPSGKPTPPGAPPLTLPVTTLAGQAKEGESCAVDQSMEEAIDEQRDLLAEFERVANELNMILANLEGSTLVKRLKAASRKQLKIAGSLGDALESTFGQRTVKTDAIQPIHGDEREEATKVSYIMDDMQAYFERRPMARFRVVLGEMRETDVLGSLRKLSDEVFQRRGLALAECEYWSDTMDRWAEDLVDPAGGGT